VTRQRTGSSVAQSLWGRYEGISDMTRISICTSGAAEVKKSSGYESFTAYPLPICQMVLQALALHMLLTYFAVAICNTGCGRKPQNQ
jgi:hypothetical protein